MDSLNEKLIEIVLQNDPLVEAFRIAEHLNLPDWHIGAGCIAQTVWNHFHGYTLDAHISDVDLVYFDSTDLSFEAEDKVIKEALKQFKGFSIPVDIKNQARVHLWYADRFGYEISPYSSTQQSIDSWPTTATAVALRYDGSGYIAYAPYGLWDLFALIVRANKVQITRDIYESKCKKWRSHWPKLRFLSWDIC